MLKPFFLFVSFLFLFLGALGTHCLLSDFYVQEQRLDLLSQITGISAPSFSVKYYEPRLRCYEDAYNPAYPQMQAMTMMDFVYAE